jgi:hypothetical protein
LGAPLLRKTPVQENVTYAPLAIATRKATMIMQVCLSIILPDGLLSDLLAEM